MRADLTVFEGSCFAISADDGDMTGDLHGLYYRDTRILSRWRLTGVEPLAAHQDAPYQATFLGRLGRIFVERRRVVGDGMREEILLRNPSPQAITTPLAFEYDTDLTDVFSIRWGTVPLPCDGLGIRVQLPTTEIVVPPRGEWRGEVRVVPVVDGVEVAPSDPVARARAWRAGSGTVEGRVFERSLEDLGALRVDGAVAAGAPWYMTLFGRDSLLTAWMALPVNRELALTTLTALAALQGSRVDPSTEEQPGRIPHEVRHGPFPLSPDGRVYYGTADATPLFCMLVGELHRWGVPGLQPLLPHVDRALDWILSHDGFVTYQRTNAHGLLNQGWKDSSDSMVFADGRLAATPIALAEVQAYVYGAFVARSELAATFDDSTTVRRWADRAAEFRTRFNEAFWLPDHGYLAMALDADQRPVDALASNMGHCLWTGILEPAHAGQVAAHLTSPELFSGWGVRTLATTMAAYDPVSYHNGSVWPHDSAICAAGLARYGFLDEATRIGRAVLDAAAHFDGRLPELFCGFDRSEYDYPVPYPTSCSPQAWAAAAPFLLLRAMS